MDAHIADPERSMLKRLRGTARYFDSKIGLHRIGVALSLTKRQIGALSSSPPFSSPPDI